MKRCSVCNGEFDDKRVFCPDDGVTLRTVEGKDALIGRILDAKYRIEERLGRGGMGSVYRARHMLIGDLVAIKVLRPDLAGSPDAVERFRREARAARHLRGPHLIHVIDFSASDDGLVYLVMEYVAGQSLREVLNEAKTLNPRRAASIVSQVATALDEAHQMGVVHRDLKPDNVMVERRSDGDEFVRVLDFGIAKMSNTDTRMKTLTSEDTILGTPCYFSPEQCGAGPVGPWSDIYSLGIMLFELVTGDVPFDGGTALEVARKHLFTAPPSPRERIPSLPQEAEAVILKAIEKEPEFRYASASALAAAFAEAVGAVAEAETVRAKMGTFERSFVETSETAPRATDPDQTGTIEAEGLLGRSKSGETPGRAEPDAQTSVPTIVDASAPTPAARGLAAPPRGVRLPRWTPWAALAVVLLVMAVGLGPRLIRSAPAPETEMILVPAGEFLMGSDDPRGDYQDEHPPHRRFLPAYYIDKTEVTNAQYRAYCDATGRTYPKNPEWGQAYDDYFLSKPNYPVVSVSWNDAHEYAKWAGKRLPTEAEWEKAARGEDGRTFPWGNEMVADAASVEGTADGFANTAPVGSFPAGASPYGCQDMIGNVYEWVEDWYGAYPGSDGSWDEKGDIGFKKRCLRGGGWTSKVADLVHASARFCEKTDYRSFNLGFRCARTP